LDSGNAAMMRLLGQELQQLNYLDLAVLTFEEVLRLRPDDPQSYRDLALALAERARQTEHGLLARPAKKSSRDPAKSAGVAMAKDDYARAIDLLNQIINRHWSWDYIDIELIALEEINAIIPAARNAGVGEIPLDSRLIKSLDEDFRVVLASGGGAVAGGLKVTEPSGERAEDSHRETTIGGLLMGEASSGRVAGGSGPEEYAIRKAMHGKFKMEAIPTGTSPENSFLPPVIRVDVYTNFGRPNQTHRLEILRMNSSTLRPKYIGKAVF
jgi:Ca-activated chloride channel family protein